MGLRFKKHAKSYHNYQAITKTTKATNFIGVWIMNRAQTQAIENAIQQKEVRKEKEDQISQMNAVL